MQNVLIAATFVLMVISPCIVAMRSGSPEDQS